MAYGRDGRVRPQPRCEVRDGTIRRELPPLDPTAMEAPEGEESCDVVVVGSGAGGAASARALAESGLDVIVVEEGDYHDARDYSTDPLLALPQLYRDGGLTVCEGRPAIPLPMGRCVGGTTVFNSGTCFPAPDDVLRRWRDEFGIGWATELGPECDAVMRDLRVERVEPVTAGRNAALCLAGAEAIGAENGPLARNAPGVIQCGACPTGCPLDAKQAVHVGELPRAVAAGARIRARSRVRRVLVESGRAAGVSCGGYRVRARAVVLAGGAVGTPELLLRQRLGSGPVGRHLRMQPACWVGALFDEEVRGWDGIMQSWHVGEWRDRGLFMEATFTPLPFGAHWLHGAGAEFKSRVADYGRLGVIGVHLVDRSEGRVRPGRIRYRLTDDDASTIAFGIARAAEIHFAAGAREVYPHVGGIAALRPGDEKRIEDGHWRPRDLRLEGFHPMGTARMAADPRQSVVAPSGEVHDVPGLYVADASVLPTALGVNPMVTIMAAARRIAAGLADRLG
jgi:choline dehydrogenase-like flavoprotein